MKITTENNATDNITPVSPASFNRTTSVDFLGRVLQIKETDKGKQDLLASDHRANMSMVNMEIYTVGDRMRFLEERNIQLDNKILAAAGKVTAEDVKNIAINAKFQLENMKVNDIVTLTATGTTDLVSRRALEVISLSLPDRHEPHTISIDKYLNNRVSTGVILHAKRHGCDFFCGARREDMTRYYAAKGFDRAMNISSNTSTRSQLYLNSNSGRSVLVFSGMSNETRVKHQMLQLHFSGVDVQKVNIIGSIDTMKVAAISALKTELSTLPVADNKTLFIGARWQIMEFIGKHHFGIDASEPEGRGYAQLAPREHNPGGFIFDTATIRSDKGTQLYAALRMPNGDLAGDATKAFIEQGFDKIIMCGAGGRLAGSGDVGDYVTLQKSQYGHSHYNLPDGCIDLPPSALFSGKLTSNITVDSPLQESQRWLDDNKLKGSVDVETAHIFRAIVESDKPTKVVPGLFISDVVGAHPLEEKISTDQAYKRLEEFVGAVL